jgi:hypothetical protein
MNVPPVIREPPRSLPWVLAATGAALLVLAVLFVLDPAQHAFYPRCLFHATTGLYCPGCGGLRGLHELLHGHWLAALRLNLLAFGLAPLLILLGLSEWLRHGKPRGGATIWNQPWFVWLLVGGVVAFGVLRNLPVPPFTLLAP